MSKVALFDMDGTLFNHDQRLQEEYRLLMSPGEVEPDDLHDETIPYVKSRIKLIRQKPGWWRTLPKFDLGWDVYDIAKDIGFCIHILTKGPVSNPAAWSEKVACIQDHFGSDVVVNIVGRTKKHFYGSFLCDDYPPYITDWLEHRPRGLVIMPAHKYNKDFSIPRVIRYDGDNIDDVKLALTVIHSRNQGETLRDAAERVLTNYDLSAIKWL